MTSTNPDRNQLNSAQLNALAALASFKGVRRQSEYVFLGLPLYSIAFGPDVARGEWRGHAKGVLAVGDVATGFVAVGGLAVGGVAVGGLAIGLLALGGFAIGILIAIGGAAIGIIAFGGGALGVVAIGGAAAGYYAAGGAGYGTYVLDAMRQSPEAIEFFSRWEILRWVGLFPLRR